MRAFHHTSLPALLLALCLALPGGVLAEEEEAEPAGVLTKAPVLVHFEDAPYPPEAQAAGITGTVKLALVIDETGAVSEVEVLEPAGHGFDEAAMEAARKFRFEPAEVDGAPAAVQVTYDYGFVLEVAPPEELDPEEPQPPEVRLAGRVLVRGQRDPVAAAIVQSGEVGTRTDAEGRFELADLPPGEQPVRVLMPGFETFETTETIAEGEVVEVVYYLLAESFDPYHTVVRGRKPRKEVTRRTLTMEEVKRIPGTRGDALRVVQTLPGVARTPYGLGPLLIRGSDPYDSRSFLDGHWIPLPFHFGGLTSIINSDLIEEIELVPGNFSSKYGRTLAGVLTVKTRPGTPKALHGYVDVDFYDAGFLVEGPMPGSKKDEKGEPKTTFAAAARRSYVDTVLNFVLHTFVSGADQIRVVPFYWDYQLKLDHELSGRDDLSVTVYGSHDALTVTTDDPEALGPELRGSIENTIDFHRVVAGWKRRQSASVTGETSLALGWDATAIQFGQDIFFDARGLFVSARSDWSWRYSDQLSLDTGVDLVVQDFTAEAQFPAVAPPGQVIDPLVRDDLLLVEQPYFNVQPATYLEASWKPVKPLHIVAGLRLDTEPTAPEPHLSLDPRLSVGLKVAKQTLLKGGAGIFHQPPNPFGTFGDFGNPFLGWEGARHYSVGVEHRLLPFLQVDLELFYQDRFDRLIQTAAYVERDGELVPQNFSNEGSGAAFGLELYLKIVDVPGVTAWLSYTLSRALAVYELGDPLEVFYGDQTHNLVLIGSWELGGGWAVGGALRYVTGTPETPFAGAFYDADADFYLPIPGQTASGGRMPAFFSLDLRVDRRFTFEKWRLDLYLDVTNVTNYPNVEGYRFNFDYTDFRRLPGLPIFPSLGIKGEL
ncbi:MAG: TonB-dependent receptor [Deltaproteobacteria bacterium]|nr:TonB-dependent receptor [Deltaproteobacteria bacterium]